MADPFIGELRLLPYTYAPYGWMPCDGRILQIVQYTALYSLLGTQFGGDGRTNFGLPNLPGRVVVGAGNGPGLTPRRVGDLGGDEGVTLNTAQTPSHAHAMQGSSERGTSKDAADGIPADPVGSDNPYLASGAKAAFATPTPPGGVAQPHDNMMPSLSLQYCIAVQGLYPPRP